MTKTIINLIKSAGLDDIALGGVDRPSLTYHGLIDQAETTVNQLNALGIGRNDRVAIVLPNGPEMASAFLSVGCGATTAPLNPAYREDELNFYLSDLNAKALLIEHGTDNPAREVAQTLNIPILEIDWAAGDPAGTFCILGDTQIGTTINGGFSRPEDGALVLHTSGTTSRPKIVPLTNQNVCASAKNIASTLRLRPEDRCLNVMPLFHIHGLIAAVLSSLSAGSSVFCAPGFNALNFFNHLGNFQPSWYTAVPTMHQTILARAGRNQEIINQGSLRFVRSSSASLPPQVMTELEKVFDCPVIEAYGMTEASHQMASNPLPGAIRKPGSVGIAAGPEIAIMAQRGSSLLAAGDTGEIVIRGENVFNGYENNKAANAEAFSGEWFRTGDQGVMDEYGYLQITGRLKEIINRGGEKISPREVDEILMDHPAIQQAVTFAVPHEKLGEDIAAAVVLEDGAETTANNIREFARSRLADFKVPREVLILDEIPKGATGKIQRIGLAAKLGLG